MGLVTELVIREVTEVAELVAVADLFASIWGRATGDRPVAPELLRAMAMTGNYVAGASVGGALKGASFGFLAHDGLHSHITGVIGAGRGVGHALKQHQREWALRHGLKTISWTFDPLVRRNAHFNLAKLGARPVTYLPDFYGAMPDAINGSDKTDRLLVHWDLVDGPQWTDPGPATPALSVGDNGEPVEGDADGPVVLVATPPDIEALRRTDPELARSWRSASRRILRGLLDSGAEIVGFDQGSYVIVREQQ
jgi:predicted GNAT superfamily acetyltransferase